MRLNAFIAHHTEYSRREADELIAQERAQINGHTARIGQRVENGDVVAIDGQTLSKTDYIYLLLHKPAGYVCSRRGQGAETIYDLLPEGYSQLKTAGRIDKDSSGLVLLTNDGTFAHKMTHPSQRKSKVYEVTLREPLSSADESAVRQGVVLEDGSSSLDLEQLDEQRRHWRITMQEGRNRQIRRTFAALDNEVVSLHRTQFGPYHLNGLKSGEYKEVGVHSE